MNVWEHSKICFCFSYEGKTGEERDLVIFNDTPMNNHVNGELLMKRFSFVDRFIFKNNQITHAPCFTFVPKTGLGLPNLKQGLVLTENNRLV